MFCCGLSYHHLFIYLSFVIKLFLDPYTLKPSYKQKSTKQKQIEVLVFQNVFLTIILSNICLKFI